MSEDGNCIPEEEMVYIQIKKSRTMFILASSINDIMLFYNDIIMKTEKTYNYKIMHSTKITQRTEKNKMLWMDIS